MWTYQLIVDKDPFGRPVLWDAFSYYRFSAGVAVSPSNCIECLPSEADIVTGLHCAVTHRTPVFQTDQESILRGILLLTHRSRHSSLRHVYAACQTSSRLGNRCTRTLGSGTIDEIYLVCARKWNRRNTIWRDITEWRGK